MVAHRLIQKRADHDQERAPEALWLTGCEMSSNAQVGPIRRTPNFVRFVHHQLRLFAVYVIFYAFRFMGQRSFGCYTCRVTKKRQIGLRVRAYRLERKLTQEQLAEMIDRSVETISNLERGVSIPNEATLHRLATSFEVSLEELLAERRAPAAKRPIEYFQAAEVLK